MKHPSDLTRARAKRALGQQLTEAERVLLRREDAKYLARKATIHIGNAAVKQEWFERAHACGLSFSEWAQQQIEQNLMPQDSRHLELARENEKLRDEVAGLRSSNGMLATENGSLHARTRELEGKLYEALGKLVRITEVRA